MNQKIWNKFHKTVKAENGLIPDSMLRDYAKLVPKGKVLDIGSGNGRNSLLFSKLGFDVDAVDFSKEGVKKCAENAARHGLKIHTFVCDILELDIPKSYYSLIIVAWVLPFFLKKDVRTIVTKIKEGLCENGIVFATAFNLEDPGYLKAKSNYKTLGNNSFYSKKIRSPISYYTKAEFLKLFKELELVCCMEGVMLDLLHDKPHYHGVIEYVGKKI